MHKVRRKLCECASVCARIQQCPCARLADRAAPHNARPFPSLISPYPASFSSPAHLRACARLADKRRNRTGRPHRSTTRHCPARPRPGTSLLRALPFGFCQSSASCFSRSVSTRLETTGHTKRGQERKSPERVKKLAYGQANVPGCGALQIKLSFFFFL